LVAEGGFEAWDEAVDVAGAEGKDDIEVSLR
jgi:hypothetical protein